MTSPNVESPSSSEMCAHVKRLGYSTSKHVRLYGEDFEVVSDPFAEADGVDFLNAGPTEIVFGANMTTLTFHLARALGRSYDCNDEILITGARSSRQYRALARAGERIRRECAHRENDS